MYDLCIYPPIHPSIYPSDFYSLKISRQLRQTLLVISRYYGSSDRTNFFTIGALSLANEVKSRAPAGGCGSVSTRARWLWPDRRTERAERSRPPWRWPRLASPGASLPRRRRCTRRLLASAPVAGGKYRETGWSSYGRGPRSPGWGRGRGPGEDGTGGRDWGWPGVVLGVLSLGREGGTLCRSPQDHSENLADIP